MAAKLTMITLAFGLLLAFAGIAHAGDDIYTVSKNLDPGETFSKVKQLDKGKYRFRVSHVDGDSNEIFVEAELSSGACSFGKTKCEKDASIEVTFTVSDDDDEWEISVTNDHDDDDARVRAKLTKID